MKTFNLILIKLKSFGAVEILTALFILALIIIPSILKKIKKNRQDLALIKNEYGYVDENGNHKIKYIRFMNYILFVKYNFKKTLINFQEEQEILEDVFENYISKIKRFYFRTILIELANFNKKLTRLKNEITLGWNGIEYIYLTLKIRMTVLISGEMGFGKSKFILSIYNQFRNIYKENNKITIISSKPEDYPFCLTYAENKKEIFEELTAYELQRQNASRNKIQLLPTLIIVDECHNLDKESGAILTTLIKEGRSQNFIVILGTQSPNIDSMKNIDISNMSVKLVIRNTQTESSGKVLFNESTAKKAFFQEQDYGYGWMKAQGFRLGALVKLYYEELEK